MDEDCIVKMTFRAKSAENKGSLLCHQVGQPHGEGRVKGDYQQVDDQDRQKRQDPAADGTEGVTGNGTRHDIHFIDIYYNS